MDHYVTVFLDCLLEKKKPCIYKFHKLEKPHASTKHVNRNNNKDTCFFVNTDFFYSNRIKLWNCPWEATLPRWQIDHVSWTRRVWRTLPSIWIIWIWFCSVVLLCWILVAVSVTGSFETGRSRAARRRSPDVRIDCQKCPPSWKIHTCFP